MSESNESTRLVERLLTAEEVARLIPSRRKNRTVSSGTVRRWWQAGLRGRFLKFRQVGGVKCCTQEDLQEFISQLTTDEECDRFVHVSDPPRSPTKAAKAAEKRREHFNKLAEGLGL